MALQLNALETFVRVTELGSFSKAAISLGVAQSSITRIVAELETEMAGELFHRTGRGVQLTSLGEMMLPRVRSLLQSADQLGMDAVAFGKTPVGMVSVAALPSVLQSIAGTLYDTIRIQAPGIRLRLHEGFSDQVERWVSEGQSDIGLLSRYKSVQAGREDVLFQADLMLVRPPADLDPAPEIAFAQLSGLPLVLPSIPNGLRMVIEETARRHRIKLNVVVEADSLGAQRDIMLMCGCYSIMVREAAETGLPLLRSRLIDPAIERSVVLITTQQRPLSKAARVVMQALRHSVLLTRPINSLDALAETLRATSPVAVRVLPDR